MGGGIPGYLQNLWNAVTGNPAQAATPPPQGQTPAMPAAGAATPPPAAPAGTPPTGGAAAPAAGGGTDWLSQLSQMPAPSQGLLDSPGLQGALSAYFGAISSPRQQGLGGAIGHGGLAGLQAYEQAKTAQYQPYL